MANLALPFAEVLVGGVLLDAAIKGDSIANVVRGVATAHPINASSSDAGAPAAGPGAVAPGTYTNPVPGASTGRIDMGVDYTLGAGGFVAPGKSKVLIADRRNAGWKGGGYIAAQLLDGPLAGRVYYVAEGIAPAAGVAVGAVLDAGTQLVTRIANPYNGRLGNIEAGWATPGSPATPLGHPGYIEGVATAAGHSFSSFVHSLGGVAGR